MDDVLVEFGKNAIDEYLIHGDLATENANMTWNPSGILFSVGGEILKIDYLNRLRENGFHDIVDMYNDGVLHIHDLSLGFISPYCCGHSLPNLLDNGITAGSILSYPAKHLRTAINHVVNFIGSCSNEFAGAQAFSDIDVYLSPYAYKVYLDFLNDVEGNEDIAMKLAEKEIKQSIQEFIYHMNYNTRYGGQSPFSNITLALFCPDDMYNREAIICNGTINLTNYSKWVRDTESVTYGKLEMWQNKICEKIFDVFLEGDGNGRGFTFPVLTLNVTEKFFQSNLKEKIYKLTAKYGTPFFQNYINGVSGGKKIHTGQVRSMCCRLLIDEDEIQSHVGGLFGNAEQTGSIQVVTLSLPYIAYECKDDIEMFFNKLSHVMERVKDEQLWKRDIVCTYFEKGLFQFAKTSLSRGFDTFFTTIGFIGLWECVSILLSNTNSFLTEDGLAVAKSILKFMNNKVKEFSKSTGKLFNLEAVPGESATYKLAKKALAKYPDILHRGSKSRPYFTNSCHIPVEIQNRLDYVFLTQNELQPIPSGGTVVHFYTGESLLPEDVENIIESVCQTNIPYFSISVIYSECPICGYVVGAHEFCPNKHTKEQIDDLKKYRPDLVVENMVKTNFEG